MEYRAMLEGAFGLLAVSCLVISSSSSFSVSWSWLSGLSTCVVGSSNASMAGSSALTFFFFFLSLGGSATASLCGKTQEGGRGGQSTRGSGDAPTNRLLPFERMRRISRIGAREEAASRGRRERGIGRKRDGMVRVMSLARARGVRGSVAPPEACVGRRSGNASAPSDARGAESADAPEKRARTRSAPSWAASRAPADPTRGPTLDLTPGLRVRRVGVRLPGRRARRECATPCQNGLRKAAESLRAARQ